VNLGSLEAEAVARIVELQRESGLRFGEAALELGLLAPEEPGLGSSRPFEPVLLTPDSSAVDPSVLAAYQPGHSLVESLRRLRSELLLRWLEAPDCGRILAVASPERREGRSFVAANLAVLFAQLGLRTLLVDGDLRRPRQHLLFGLDAPPGLSAVLAERADHEAVVQVTGLSGLSVLPAGSPTPNPQELLSRPRFGQFLEQAAAGFDLVLVDTPAFSVASDAQVIAARAGAALLVSRPHVPSTASAKALVEGLGQGHAKVLGVALNRR
jgi:receptor protein-tyrosine kinase